MYALRNTIRDYAWGSKTAIADLLAEPSPSAGPEAELWMGAHPSAPSLVERDGAWRPLDACIAQDAERMLGARVVARFGPELPFLLKVLAAAAPLSLQAHPNQAQAEAGFRAEEAAGVPLSAPHRNYKDPHHKPELLCALGPFHALCGFRRASESLRLLEELKVPALAPYVETLRRDPGGAGLRALVSSLLTAEPPARREIAEATLSACEERRAAPGPFAGEYAWAARIGAIHPGDAGIVTALLLNLLELAPGQAIYLPAGNLHAYLEGVGVEIMASSDNVLRGGLTPKHVDVAELLAVLDFSDGDAHPLLAEPAGPHELVYRTPAPEFRLSRLEPASDGELRLADREGPEILLAVSGSVRVRGDGRELTLARGQSLFVPAAAGAVALHGRGSVFRARVNSL